MREIKFRAWNIAIKVMIDLRAMTPLALNMDTDGLFIPFSDGLILEQFTGQKDIDGVKIWEGDKVRKHIKDNKRTELIEVAWLENQCGFNISKGKNHWYEVIGNIHNDPK